MEAWHFRAICQRRRHSSRSGLEARRPDPCLQWPGFHQCNFQRGKYHFKNYRYIYLENVFPPDLFIIIADYRVLNWLSLYILILLLDTMIKQSLTSKSSSVRQERSENKRNVNCVIFNQHKTTCKAFY